MNPCEFCDTDQLQVKKRVTVTRHRGGKWFIFEDVPAWVCPNCGHRYFDADVLESMETHNINAYGCAPDHGMGGVIVGKSGLSETPNPQLQYPETCQHCR